MPGHSEPGHPEPGHPEPDPGSYDPGSYDDLPGRYDRIAVLRGAAVRTWLRSQLPPRGDRAVDLGCGTGLHTGVLAEHYDAVDAVDRSEPMLDYARARRGHRNVRYDLRDLMAVQATGQYDLVVCIDTLHQLDHPAGALIHLTELTRPGGLLLVAVPVDAAGAADADAGAGAAGPTTRAQLRSAARRLFAEDLLHRRRPILDAVELLRLQLDPDWLDHLATYPPLPESTWVASVQNALPGAAITAIGDGIRALTWRAPAAGLRQLGDPGARAVHHGSGRGAAEHGWISEHWT